MRAGLATVILSIVWLLWPVVSLLGGGQGFGVLAGVAAIAVAPIALRSFRPRLYMAGLLAFFVYAAASAKWSPLPFSLVEFNLAKGALNVRSDVLRIAPLFIATGLLLAASMQLNERQRARLTAIAGWGLLAQLFIVIGLTVFEAQVLEAMRPLVPDTGETVQNITRNCLIMCAAAAGLVATLSGDRPLRSVMAAAVLIFVVEAAVIAIRDVDAGFLALGGAAVCIAIVHLLPRNGFRVLGVVIALGILTAPPLFGFLSRGAQAELAVTSSQQRLAIWAKTGEVINQHPWFGGGVGILRTMRDRIPSGPHANEFYIPNHPHNMALQLWAETGAAGAILLSLAILLAAWRLPAPRDMGRGAFHVGGMIGAAVPIAFVSFDLWNPFWWAIPGLLGILAVVAPRKVVEAAQTGAGITFGQELAPAPGSGLAPAAAYAASSGQPEPAAMQGRAPTGPDHANNFNLLRLAFAVMVAAYHLVRLAGVQPQTLPFMEVLAEIGVQGFFVVSGYLVYASLERSPSLAIYAEKRVRRLYPAYATVILVTALASLAFSPAARAGLSDVARYLGGNLVFLNFVEPRLPGVFDHNPVTEVNGALWTLKIEVMFYVILPALAWLLAKLPRWPLIGVVYVGAEIWRYTFEHAGPPGGMMFEIARQLPGQLSFFVAGMALYIVRNSINWRSLLVPVALIGLAASFLSPGFEVLRAASLAVVIVWAAVVLPRSIDAAAFGDLSYGVYIIHFPIIQVVVALGLFARPAQGTAIVLLATLGLSLAMWWLIERPALRRDSAYRTPG